MKQLPGIKQYVLGTFEIEHFPSELESHPTCSFVRNPSTFQLKYS